MSSLVETVMAAIRAALRDAEDRFPLRDRALAELATREEELHEQARKIRLHLAFYGHSDESAARAAVLSALQALTPQRHSHNSACGETLRTLWDVSSRAIEVVEAHARTILEAEGRRLDALVLPTLLPHLLPDAEASVAEFASSTPKGNLAASLRSRIAEQAQIQEGNVLGWLGQVNDESRFKGWMLQDMRRQAVKRAEAILAAWSEFVNGIQALP